jgi:hypothetical protein
VTATQLSPIAALAVAAIYESITVGRLRRSFPCSTWSQGAKLRHSTTSAPVASAGVPTGVTVSSGTPVLIRAATAERSKFGLRMTMGQAGLSTRKTVV